MAARTSRPRSAARRSSSTSAGETGTSSPRSPRTSPRRARPRRPEPRHHHRRPAEDGRIPGRDRRLRPGLDRHPQAQRRASTSASIRGANRSAEGRQFLPRHRGGAGGAQLRPRDPASPGRRRGPARSYLVTQPVLLTTKALSIASSTTSRRWGSRSTGSLPLLELPQRRVPPHQRGPRHAGARGGARADALGRRRSGVQVEGGVAIAREMLAAVRSRVQGAYTAHAARAVRARARGRRRIPGMRSTPGAHEAARRGLFARRERARGRIAASGCSSSSAAEARRRRVRGATPGRASRWRRRMRGAPARVVRSRRTGSATLSGRRRSPVRSRSARGW